MIDVSHEINLGSGRANPFGWSDYPIEHLGREIGSLYCGYPRDMDKEYVALVVEVDENTTKLVVKTFISEEDLETMRSAHRFASAMTTKTRGEG